MTTSMSGNHLYKARRSQIEPNSEEIVTGKDGDHVFVYNQTKETFLAFRVKVADTVLGRMTGLLGKKSLNPDSGVWIVPAPGPALPAAVTRTRPDCQASSAAAARGSSR